MRALSLVALLLAALPASAAVGAVDPVPGATLLLPHFEIDEPTSIFTVRRRLAQPKLLVGNAAATPVLAHVTLWTDLGIPTVAFDVYIPGNDVVEINVRLALHGIFPPTGPAVTAAGGQPTVDFPNCSAMLPPPRLARADVARIRAAHRGEPLPGTSTCAGHADGDGKLRGYVTIDAVNRCSRAFPGDAASGSEPAYFVSGGTGIASNRNVLWGLWSIEDDWHNQLALDRLVAIEASATLSVAGTYTFYGRRIGGSAADNRERLPAVWHTWFVNGGWYDRGTTLVVWRDPGLRAPFPCSGAEPALMQREVTVFDEETHAFSLSAGSPPGYKTLLPRAAERVATSARFPSPFYFGFYHLDLNFPASSADPLFGNVNQAHVCAAMSAAGRFGVALASHPVEGVEGPMYPIP